MDLLGISSAGVDLAGSGENEGEDEIVHCNG
jgi:hypothetical protein